MAKKTLIVVTGPTAVGKTALSVELAQSLHTEIVSADARQCYQGMAIGTAQPTAEELAAVPHHLVGFLPVEAHYSAGKFAQDALATLQRLFERHDCVVMTGGAGLYVRAVCEGLDEVPAVAPWVRERLQSLLASQGLPVLLGELQQRDPAYYNLVDHANPQRVLRALEVCWGTGRPYSSWRVQRPAIRPFRTIKVGLSRERQVLYERIDGRVEDMVRGGLLAEAAVLHAYKDYPALQTVGYQELFSHWDGAYDLAEALRRIKRNTRRYAKRQLTWWRRDGSVQWFRPEQGKEILDYVSRMTQLAR